MSTRSLILKSPPGTAEWVVRHADWQRRQHKNPSATFLGISNPRTALQAARKAFSLKGVPIGEKAEKSSGIPVRALLKQKPDLLAFYDEDTGRLRVDGLFPAVTHGSFFCWRTSTGKKAMGVAETPPMRIFRDMLFDFAREVGAIEFRELPMG